MVATLRGERAVVNVVRSWPFSIGRLRLRLPFGRLRLRLLRAGPLGPRLGRRTIRAPRSSARPRHDRGMPEPVPLQYDPGYGPLITTRVRIATWNLWGRYGPWEERLSVIIDNLCAINADILALQEVWEDD